MLPHEAARPAKHSTENGKRNARTSGGSSKPTSFTRIQGCQFRFSDEPINLAHFGLATDFLPEKLPFPEQMIH